MKPAWPFSLEHTFWPAVLALVASWVFVQGGALDLQGQAWLNSPAFSADLEGAQLYRDVFSRIIPAAMMGLIALAAFMLALGPTRQRKQLSSPPLRRRDLLVVVATLVSTPVVLKFGVRWLPGFYLGEDLAWGFAAVALTGLGRTSGGRWRAFAAGLALGLLSVVYPLFHGGCAPSQPLIALLVSWLVFLGWRQVFGAQDRHAATTVVAPGGQACGGCPR